MYCNSLEYLTAFRFGLSNSFLLVDFRSGTSPPVCARISQVCQCIAVDEVKYMLVLVAPSLFTFQMFLGWVRDLQAYNLPTERSFKLENLPRDRKCGKLTRLGGASARNSVILFLALL